MPNEVKKPVIKPPSSFQKPPVPTRPVNRPVIRPAAPPQIIMPKVPPPAVRPNFPPRPAITSKPPVGKPIHSQVSSSVRPQAMPVTSTVRPQAMPRPAAVKPQMGQFASVGVGLLALNTASAHQEVSSDINSLNSSLQDLQERSAFSKILSDVNDLDRKFTESMEVAESARAEGYRFQNDIESSLYDNKGKWDAIRNQLITNTQKQAGMIQSRLPTLNPQIQQLNNVILNPVNARPVIQSLQSQVNTLLNNIRQLENTFESSYNPIKESLGQMETRLKDIHWSMDQIIKACFKLNNGEDLIIAVPARWDKEGNEDPEGILYLTNTRLIYERNEKVAKKKILFITVESELVQEVMIDQPLSGIQSTKAENKGLFGNQDYILVQFKDGKLGTVPFHINGQDSKTWVEWIQKACNGTIERNRSNGAEVSLADMTGPITAASIVNLQNEISSLQDDLMLKSSRQDLAELENSMRSLERDLGKLRARGYVIERSLEGDIEILSAQWNRVKENAETTISNQSRLLSEQSQSLQQMMAQLAGMMNNLMAARPLYLQTKSAATSAKSQAEAAGLTVTGQYQSYQQEVAELASHLEWINWMLEALSSATFRLLATESGVAATEATWQKPDGQEPENGILFLTDQRLLWEDRVGDFELKFNVHLQLIQDVQKGNDSTDQRETLKFSFASGAPYPTAIFNLSVPMAVEWVKMVGRAKAGDYASDRAVSLDPAELEKVKNAPQKCSNCGAALTDPILRGQTEIRCVYCGNVIRL